MERTAAIELAFKESTRTTAEIAAQDAVIESEVQLRTDVYTRAGLPLEQARSFAMKDAQRDRKAGIRPLENPEVMGMRMSMADSFVSRGEPRPAAEALALQLIPMAEQPRPAEATGRTSDAQAFANAQRKAKLDGIRERHLAAGRKYAEAEQLAREQLMREDLASGVSGLAG